GTASAPAAHPLALARGAGRRTQILQSHRSSTFRQNGTARIIPRMLGVSSCSTTCLMWRSPGAFTVGSWFGDRSMVLLARVTLSLLATGCLLAVALGGLAPGRVRGLQLLHAAKGVHGGLEDVVRIVGPERLGEDILDAGRLEHRANRAAGDDARSLRGGLEIDASGAEVADDLAGDGGVLERHEHQVLLGVLHRLANGLRDLARLPQPDADMAVAVPHDDERRERESPATLDDLGDPVDRHHPVREIQRTGIDPRLSHSDPPHPSSELEPGGPRRLRERFDPAVVLVTAPVEHRPGDP